MVFLWFPKVFLWLPMVFLWFSYGFPMVFLRFSYGFPKVSPWGNPVLDVVRLAALLLGAAAGLDGFVHRGLDRLQRVLVQLRHELLG